MYVLESTIGHDDDVVSRARFGSDEGNDVFGGTKCRCISTTHPYSFGDAVRRKRLLRRQVRGAKYLRNDSKIRGRERLNESFFKYSSPTRLRPWLEDRPDPRFRISVAHGAQGFLDSGRMMGEVVVDSNAIHFTANFQSALDAFKRRQAALDHLIRNTQFLGDYDGAQRVLNVECAGKRN